MSRFSFSAKRKTSTKSGGGTPRAASGAPAPGAAAPTAAGTAAPGPVVRTVGQETIAKLAYEIWIKKGRAQGQELQNWREAEAQLRAAQPVC